MVASFDQNAAHIHVESCVVDGTEFGDCILVTRMANDQALRGLSMHRPVNILAAAQVNNNRMHRIRRLVTKHNYPGDSPRPS